MGFLFNKKSAASASTETTSTQSVGGENRLTQFLQKRRGMRGHAAAMLTTGNQAPATAQRQVTGN